MKKIIIILTALILILITCYTGYFFSLYKEVLTRNFSDNIIQEVCTSNIGEGDKLENYVYIYIDNEKKYEIYLDLRYDSDDKTYFRGLIENLNEGSGKRGYLLQDLNYKVIDENSNVIIGKEIVKENFVHEIYEFNLDFACAKFKSRMKNLSINKGENLLISKYTFPDDYSSNLKIFYYCETYKIENITVESKYKYNENTGKYRVSTNIIGQCDGQTIKIIHNYNH